MNKMYIFILNFFDIFKLTFTGRTSKMKNNNKKIEKNELSKVEQLEKELEYLRAENAVLKKLREIRLKQSQTKKKQK